MQASNLPSKVLLPFADSGTKNTIPVASQVGITPGAASLETGFPPLTFTPLASGGVPPAGADFNGILNLITGVQQWQSAGGIFKYDSAFSTSVGGYPKGAILESSDGSTLWLCLADNNTTDPEGAAPANWAAAAAYGIAAITGLTNTNVTLTPAQYSKQIITLTGTLTGNVQIIFPAAKQQWIVANNTNGAFAVTCKTASGTGAIIAQGLNQSMYGDGTNLIPITVPRGIQTFTSNGTFTVPAGVTNIYVSACAGGGGGGGGAGNNSVANASGGGGGGGAGQSTIRAAYAVTPGQAIAITIGGGGTAGANGAAGANSGGVGGSGGNTVIGTLLTLTGGGGGGGGGNGVPGVGGASGTGFPNGSYGCDGAAFCSSGAGGSSPFGGGGGLIRGTSGGAGASGVTGGFGGGGSGGAASYAAATVSGGSGGSGGAGIAIIEW